MLYQVVGLVADLDIVYFVDAANCFFHIGLQLLVRLNAIRLGN